MGRQRGGAVFYDIPEFLRSVRAVNSVIEHIVLTRINLPNPAQTADVCSTDAVLTTLFYSDVVRQWVWQWVFDNCVEGGVINIPDEQLTSEYLLDMRVSYQVRTLRQAKAFLATGAARILRILAKYPRTSLSYTRTQSATPAPEMHGKTPSEMCAILAIALAGSGDETKTMYGSLDPGGETPKNLRMSRDASRIVLEKAFQAIERSPRTKKFDGGVELSGEVRIPTTRMTVAIYMNTTPITTDRWFSTQLNARGYAERAHAVSLIHINGNWYVSDNELGVLLKMKTFNSKEPLTENVIRKSYLHQTIQKIAESDRKKYAIPSRATPAVARYFLMDKEQLKKIVAITDDIGLLHEDTGAWDSFPVGYTETWREFTATPENKGLLGKALFDYYQTIPVTPEEAESDAADTEEQKKQDMRLGSEFLRQRLYYFDATDPEVANMVRRIGKMAVRIKKIRLVPETFGERVYCHVRRPDAPPSLYLKRVGSPLPTIVEKPHPAFTPVLTDAQRQYGISVINTELAVANTAGDAAKVARYTEIQKLMTAAQRELDDAKDGSDANRLNLAYMNLDAVLIAHVPDISAPVATGTRGPAAAGATEGGRRRYSRRVRQWGSRKGGASSTRRRGLKPRRR
jgi:hypothetical protein